MLHKDIAFACNHGCSYVLAPSPGMVHVCICAQCLSEQEVLDAGHLSERHPSGKHSPMVQQHAYFGDVSGALV